MSRAPIRYLTAAVLLAAGIVGTQWMAVEPSIPVARVTESTHQPPFRYVLDIDTWRATDRQTEAFSFYDFTLGPALQDIPLRLGKWAGQEIPERNQEVYLLLEPEQFVKRLYEVENDPQHRYVWLYLIGSRQLKSFHHPDICYSAIDWQTTVSSERIALDEGDLHALKIAARNSAEQQISLYFFIFPDDSYDETRGLVMLRVASPAWGDEESTIALQKDLIRQLFTAAAPIR